MKLTTEDLRRIAEVEYADIVVDSQPLGEKARLFLFDASYIDLWLSRKLEGRFGYHWERGHIDGRVYRYDNFANTAWRNVNTYPRHFHKGGQDLVEAAPFAEDLLVGFREFMDFVRDSLSQ